MQSWVKKIVSLGVGVPCRRAVIAAITALLLLPIEASEANWLTDAFKGSPKHSNASAHVAPSKRATSARRAALPKPHHVKVAALGPLGPSSLKMVPSTCEPKKFRIVLDVGHTAESEGATSARNIPEFTFNLRLARQIEEKLKAEGFVETRLLVTEGK
ncbi:MAG: N-acetylmuramoyl-L-alanine amidase, partial [Bradyrhizobium sp.]